MTAPNAPPDITPLSERALILRVPSQGAAQARAAALRAAGGWAEVVAGEREVGVVFDPQRETPDEATARLARACRRPAPPLAAASADPVSLRVRYGGADGPDLLALASRAGLGADEVVRRHAAPLYTVAMIGFTPGFAYLDGLDPVLRTPRLTVPRTRVPPGSVGVSEARCGLYALEGPGGWSVIGRTDAVLFDQAADPPARLTPGTRVRFVPT